MPDPLKKALDLSEKIVREVGEGQSDDAPIDLPGTQKQRSDEHPEHVVDKRTGQLERKGNAAETVRDVPPEHR